MLALGVWLFDRWSGGPVALEIHYLLGEPPVAARLEVDFRNAAELVGHFETALISPDVVENTRLPAGPVRLELTLTAPGGARRSVQREIVAERGAIIRLDLTREAP